MKSKLHLQVLHSALQPPNDIISEWFRACIAQLQAPPSGSLLAPHRGPCGIGNPGRGQLEPKCRHGLCSLPETKSYLAVLAELRRLMCLLGSALPSVTLAGARSSVAYACAGDQAERV